MHRIVRRCRRAGRDGLGHATYPKRDAQAVGETLLELRSEPVLPQRAREVGRESDHDDAAVDRERLGVEEMRGLGARVVGTVLTDVSQHEDRYGYRYGYYQYYDEDGAHGRNGNGNGRKRG